MEARDRLGGRVHTIEHGEGVLELGAQWLHGACHANSVFNLAATNGLLGSDVRVQAECVTGYFNAVNWSPKIRNHIFLAFCSYLLIETRGFHIGAELFPSINPVFSKSPLVTFCTGRLASWILLCQ